MVGKDMGLAVGMAIAGEEHNGHSHSGRSWAFATVGEDMVGQR